MKFRLIFISCLLSIIPLFLFQVYYYYSTERMIIEGKRKSSISEVFNSANDLSDKITTSIDTISLFSQLSLPQVSIEFNRPEALNDFLTSTGRKHQLFERLVVLDSKFGFFASSKDVDDFISLIEGNEKFVEVAIKLSASNQNDIVYSTESTPDQSADFLVGSKINDENGTIIGYFVGQISNKLLNNSINRLKSRLKSNNVENLEIKLLAPENKTGNICYPITIKGITKAKLCVNSINSTSSSWIKNNLLILTATIALLAVLYALIYQFFIGRILSPLYQFLRNLAKITEGNFIKQSADSRYSEINSLISSTNSIVEKLKSNQEQEIERVRIESVAKVATQAAHDIRSPLEVLKSLNEEMEFFPDSTRKRIQLSINRIEEITFYLLKKHKESVGLKPDFRSEELLSILSSILTEKTIEYGNHKGLEFKDNFSTDSYGSFSKIDRISFKSLISNLINNSIESFGNQKGLVKIELDSTSDKNIIRISDNGCGIPLDVSKNLFMKGFTTKKNGNGLGLYNAKQDIESVGGSINFSSEVGLGTTFTIILPKSEESPTFLKTIDVDKFNKIIVLDDDLAFHEVWVKRLKGLGIKIEHLYSVQDFLSRYQGLPKSTLLLSDFELMDKQLDGIDLILKLNHSSESILVTARSEEIAIQERCIKSDIKILPKATVNHIKINSRTPDVHKTSGFEVPLISTLVILIDDDKLLRLNWSIYCKNKNIPFEAFSCIEDFIKVAESFDRKSRIYVDSDLGNGIKGEIESIKIFNLGFMNLYLATGFQKEDVIKPAWIKEVYSKNPEVVI
jgi:signal transduction histidine kinase